MQWCIGDENHESAAPQTSPEMSPQRLMKLRSGDRPERGTEGRHVDDKLTWAPTASVNEEFAWA